MWVAGVMLLAATAAGNELPAPYLEALRHLRTSRNPVQRAVAAIGLGHGFEVAAPPGADPRIVEPLIESMRLDPDVGVRSMAAYALCALGDRRGVDALVGALRERLAAGVDPQGSYNETVRLPMPYLFRALGYAGGPEATRFLIETSGQGSAAARVVAISALGLVQGDNGDVDAALGALAQDRDPRIRAAVAFVLGERGRRTGRRLCRRNRNRGGIGGGVAPPPMRSIRR